MDIPTDSQMLAAVEAFLVKHDIKPSRFGLDAMGDGALVQQMRAGRSLSLRNAERVCLFMANHSTPIEQKKAA